jgi:hypothetical protein
MKMKEFTTNVDYLLYSAAAVAIPIPVAFSAVALPVKLQTSDSAFC